MTEKLYTKAEAIVKIQSGEWKEAICTNGDIIGISGEHVTFIKTSDPGCEDEIYSGLPCLGYFRVNANIVWKEHKPEVPFDKTEEESVVGMVCRGEIWEEQYPSGTIIRARHDGKHFVTLRKGCSRWYISRWSRNSKDSKWRKSENQEVEA